MNRNPFTTNPLRRRSVLAAAGTMAAAPLALAGCGGSEETGDPNKLTFLNQSRGQEAVLTALAAQYSEEQGVEITVDSPGPADYLPKLQANAQSGKMPDVYSSFNATDMASFYRAGWAKDLTEELDAGWSADFSPAIIEMSTFEEGNNLDVAPGIYTVHWETQTYGFLVNPALAGFTAADAPATTGAFIDALVNAGGGNFAVAASLTPQLVQAAASNWLTDDQIAATFNGEDPWEQDAWAGAFQFLVDLKDAGVIANGALLGGQGDNPEVETAFFTQSTAAIFDASPGVSVGFKTNPEFEDYFSIGILAADGGAQPPRSPSVPGKGAVINPKSAAADNALAFVKWLTAPEQQAAFATDARILPANPEILASDAVPAQLTGFAAGVETIQLMSATFTTDVKTAIVAESERLVLGESTVDEALANIQAAQDRTS